VRFSEGTDAVIEREARRLKRSKGSIVEELAEEALKARRFPGIAFRGVDANRRPWIVGAGLDLWEICHMLEDFSSVEALVAESHLTPAQVRLATAYREAFPEEIEEAIAENRRTGEELRRLYPFIQDVRA
jgi:hypothetical protein